jgi:hypothetical protein
VGARPVGLEPDADGGCDHGPEWHSWSIRHRARAPQAPESVCASPEAGLPYRAYRDT